jgi:hypothetical protein
MLLVVETGDAADMRIDCHPDPGIFERHSAHFEIAGESSFPGNRMPGAQRTTAGGFNLARLRRLVSPVSVRERSLGCPQ